LNEESEQMIQKLSGTVSLFYDGLEKIKQQVTTPEELIRISSLDK